MVSTGIGGMPPRGGPPGAAGPDSPPHAEVTTIESSIEQKANTRAILNEAWGKVDFEFMDWKTLET